MTEPNQAAIRAAIAAQICPFCDRGPFKMLPVHTNKIHGVDKWELRELAGYTTSDPISSEQARAAMATAGSYLTNLPKAVEALRTHGRRQQRFTTAGIANLRDNLTEWERANPEQARTQRHQALRAAHTPEATAKRAATTRRAWAAMSPEERARRCRVADPAIQAKATAAAAAANRRPPPPHGTVNRYKHHRCRCQPCRAAKAADRRRHEATTKPR